MYQLPHFREERLDIQHALIRTHPLGLLITSGPGGLQANFIPFVIYSDVATHGTLRCHLARGNPQWRELQSVEQCLVVFQGPQEYVTPSWYATKRETGKVVPTWNYVTVHAWGCPHVTEDAAWLRRQLDDLTLLKEAGRPMPWKADDAPPQFVTSQMKGIVGVEIPIDRIEGKWKVSQNRSEADQLGVVAGLHANGGTGAVMASLVAERGRLKP